jgi:uncharacterized membrane protein AbrB (regulator of aidB expression)
VSTPPPSATADYFLRMARTAQATQQRTLLVAANDLARVLTVASAAVAVAEARACHDEVGERRARQLLDEAVAELRFAEAVSTVGGTDDQPA